MKKIMAFLIIVIMLLSLSACNNTSRSGEGDLRDVVDNIQYIKKDGRCYAVLKSSPYGSSYSITHIPCYRYE
jgi:hypothetical protein